MKMSVINLHLNFSPYFVSFVVVVVADYANDLQSSKLCVSSPGKMDHITQHNLK